MDSSEGARSAFGVRQPCAAIPAQGSRERPRYGCSIAYITFPLPGDAPKRMLRDKVNGVRNRFLPMSCGVNCPAGRRIHFYRRPVWVAGVLLAAVLPAQAGMTVYGLKDIYRVRLEEISFFLVLLLVCALVFRFLWNHGVQGIEALPRIGYRQSMKMEC